MDAHVTERTQAIVLAGVHLWEESAFDNATPRPLLPVVQQPLICHALRWLHAGGLRRATICANSTSRLIRRCLGPGDSLAMDLDYYEDWTPRGPAGCARDAAEGVRADRYVVVDGTIIPQVDLAGMLACHLQSAAAVTVAVDGPADAPQERLSPVGVYVFDPHALQQAGPTGYQDIKEGLIPRLHERGRAVALYRAAGPCPRVSGLGSYLAVNEWLLERLDELPGGLAGYRRRGQAWVHRHSRVDDSAQLIGPVLVGPGSHIAAGTILIGPCVIGSECSVGAGAVVCRSIVWDSCRIGARARLDRCVLTHHGGVACGTRLYEQVCLAARPARLLERLRAWTSPGAAAAALAPPRDTARPLDLASLEGRDPPRPAQASRRPAAGAPASQRS